MPTHLESAQREVARLEAVIQYYEKQITQAEEKLKQAEAHLIEVANRYKEK
jgi:multidrug resistance efflux pump